jgi:nitronate monooxygenase
MDFVKMPELRIGNLVAKLPIIQGGMGVGISLSGLASAVANEGGIGIISSAGIGRHEPDFNSNMIAADIRAMKNEIQLARKKTNGIIGVNIMVALTDYDELVKAAVDEKADLIILGAGLPLKRPEVQLDSFKNQTTKVLPKVSSAKAARVIFQYWDQHYQHVPDGVVLEGPLAGGHLGFKRTEIDDPEFSLESQLEKLLLAMQPFEQKYNKPIPVIAAGGIYTGEDIYNILQMGAHGVKMATRFVGTYECDAHLEFKLAYINCKKEDLAIIDSPVGLPGRAIQNKYLSDVLDGIKKPYKCLFKCLKTCDVVNAPYCIALALTNAKKGILHDGFAFAGANAYRVNKLISVKKLIQDLIEEFEIFAEKAKAVASYA